MDLYHVSERLRKNVELEQVISGNNTEFDKQDFLKKVVRDKVSNYYGDRLDFYKKVMNTKVFPMIIEALFRAYWRGLGR